MISHCYGVGIVTMSGNGTGTRTCTGTCWHRLLEFRFIPAPITLDHYELGTGRCRPVSTLFAGIRSAPIRSETPWTYRDRKRRKKWTNRRKKILRKFFFVIWRNYGQKFTVELYCEFFHIISSHDEKINCQKNECNDSKKYWRWKRFQSSVI